MNGIFRQKYRYFQKPIINFFMTYLFGYPVRLEYILDTMNVVRRVRTWSVFNPGVKQGKILI